MFGTFQNIIFAIAIFCLGSPTQAKIFVEKVKGRKAVISFSSSDSIEEGQVLADFKQSRNQAITFYESRLRTFDENGSQSNVQLSFDYIKNYGSYEPFAGIRYTSSSSNSDSFLLRGGSYFNFSKKNKVGEVSLPFARAYLELGAGKAGSSTWSDTNIGFGVGWLWFPLKEVFAIRFGGDYASTSRKYESSNSNSGGVIGYVNWAVYF